MFKELSEKVIGSFNPSDSDVVTNIKTSAKALIEDIDQACPDGRRKTVAITQVEQAAMMAVKSLFADE